MSYTPSSRFSVFPVLLACLFFNFSWIFSIFFPGFFFAPKQNKFEKFEYPKQDELDAFRENLQSVGPQKRRENCEQKNCYYPHE